MISAEKPIVFGDILSETVRKIEGLDYNKIRETLLPVIHCKTKLDIRKMSDTVITKLREMFVLTVDEKQYVECFNNNMFKPDLLLHGFRPSDLTNHPMALWKTKP